MPVGTVRASSFIDIGEEDSTAGAVACSDITTGMTASDINTAANAKPVMLRASKPNTNS